MASSSGTYASSLPLVAKNKYERKSYYKDLISSTENNDIEQAILNPQKTTLNVMYGDIKSKQAEQLVTLIKQRPQISTLFFNHTKFSPAGAKIISDGFKNINTIIHFKIVPIAEDTSNGWMSLFKSPMLPQLKTFSLGFRQTTNCHAALRNKVCPYGGISYKTLFKFLLNVPSITSLYFSNAFNGNHGHAIKYLCSYIVGSGQLKILSIRNCGIYAQHFANICRSLSSNSTISHLDISSNYVAIDDSNNRTYNIIGMESLDQLLKKNSSIEYLNLSKNAMGVTPAPDFDDTFYAFSKNINNYTSLQSLDISNMGLYGDGFFVHFIRNLSTLPIIKNLNLAYNSLRYDRDNVNDDSTFNEISNLLSTNKTIKHLDLTAIEEDHYIDVIIADIKNWKVVETLKFGLVGFDSIVNVAHALNDYHGLKSVTFVSNRFLPDEFKVYNQPLDEQLASIYRQNGSITDIKIGDTPYPIFEQALLENINKHTSSIPLLVLLLNSI